MLVNRQKLCCSVLVKRHKIWYEDKKDYEGPVLVNRHKLYEVLCWVTGTSCMKSCVS